MPLRVVKISIQHSQTYCLQVVSMLFTSAKYAVYECQVCCLRVLSMVVTIVKLKLLRMSEVITSLVFCSYAIFNSMNGTMMIAGKTR